MDKDWGWSVGTGVVLWSCPTKLTGWSPGHWWSWRGRRGGGRRVWLWAFQWKRWWMMFWQLSSCRPWEIILACYLPRSINQLVNLLSGIFIFTIHWFDPRLNIARKTTRFLKLIKELSSNNLWPWTHGSEQHGSESTKQDVVVACPRVSSTSTTDVRDEIGRVW